MQLMKVTCRYKNNELTKFLLLSVQMVIMAGTVLLAYYFECTDTFGIHIQGFFCHDADLMKPYPGVEESSFIPPLILYCVVAAAPTTVVSNIVSTKGNVKKKCMRVQ